MPDFPFNVIWRVRPPQAPSDELAMLRKLTKSKRVRLWVVLVVLGVVGVALLVVAAIEDQLSRAVRDLMTAFGTAFLIAAILGGSVDRWLKKELLRDAYKLLFGYLLPDELKQELAWVSDQKLLASRFHLSLTLVPLEGDLLTLRVELSTDVCNISSETVSWEPLFALDEWFHEGRPSEIRSMHVTLDSTTHSNMAIGADNPFAIGGRLPKLSLSPGKTATLMAEGEEVRRVSDAFFLNMTRATAEPRVTVKAPEGVAFQVMFGNREQAQIRRIGTHTDVLPGTLLPGQVIQVRWWPETAAGA